MRKPLLPMLALLLALAVASGPADAVTIINGTFTDPSGLVYGKYLQGSEDGGTSYDPTTYNYTLTGSFGGYGDARDWNWIHDSGGSVANVLTGLWFDLQGQANKLVVFPIIDHGPVGPESFEYDVYLSNDLLSWTEAKLDVLYDEGWSGNPNIADGWTTVWTAQSGQTFRYASVAWGNPGNPNPDYYYADGDAEIDAVAGLTEAGGAVPEPGTMLLLALGLVPLAAKLRKDR
ncbi:MAG: PEP-CTERM sorting domain-containing protein [Candidatus Eisenbacteria bacterium]|nr:PEP-CTERM sorting domain-containing protein [Candidatus Eisenbacteria bacterium]